MLFLLNIGNTNTQIGCSTGHDIKIIKTLPTCDLTAEELPDDCQIAGATVVPAVKQRFAGRQIFWISDAEVLNIDLSEMDRSTLGADRIANAVALAEGNLPAVCIDCGTAITFELVDHDRIFKGGAIAPGRMLLRKALNSYTAQLPLLPIETEVPQKPGTNTVNAMRLGIDGGVIGSVKEIIDRLQGKYSKRLKVVVTGGDHDFFLRNIDGLEYAGDEFTLRGILKAWEMNN